MPNSNYRAGRALEYDCMKRWKREKYAVVRSAGSHGIWDVCAVRPNTPVMLIQCKRVETKAAADRLVKQFRAHPPLQADRHYHQVLEVKIKGSNDIIQTVV